MPVTVDLQGAPVAIPQWKHQAILRKHLEDFGGQVELGTALVDIEQNSESITVKLSKQGTDELEIASFGYIVGADGGKSTVRKKLGISLVGETREEGALFVVDACLEGLNLLHEVSLGLSAAAAISCKGA